MRWRLSCFVLACCVAVIACRSKAGVWNGPSSSHETGRVVESAEPKPATLTPPAVDAASVSPDSSSAQQGTIESSSPQSNAPVTLPANATMPTPSGTPPSVAVESRSAATEGGLPSHARTETSPEHVAQPNEVAPGPFGNTADSLPLRVPAVIVSHDTSNRDGSVSLPLPAPGAAQAKPASNTVTLWSTPGSDRLTPTTASDTHGLSLTYPSTGATPASSLSTPLTARIGTGTNTTPAKIDPSKPISIGPFLQEGKGETSWREQQLARHAAEQKAREEEQRKLQNALHHFLFKDGSEQ